MDKLLENLSLEVLYTGVVRWGFVILTIYILVRCIVSLIRSKNPAEVWAYMHVTGYRLNEGGEVEREREFSIPITHWENVIGRAASCDIQVEDGAISRNHGILMRDSQGDWRYQDLGSKNGTYLNDIKISKAGENGPAIKLEYGDVIRIGLTELSLLPISLEERNNNLNMRKADTKIMSIGPTLAALTLFQILTIFQLWFSLGAEQLQNVVVAIGGLCAVMWIYTAVLRSMGRQGFEMETIAFFLSTLNLAVAATSAPQNMMKQFICIVIGLCVMFAMCIFLRNLERSKSLRWILLAFVKDSYIVIAVNLLQGLGYTTFSYSLVTYIARSMPHDMRATGQTMSAMIGSVVSRILFGFIGGVASDALGTDHIMLFSAALMISSTVVFALWSRKQTELGRT